MTEDKLKDLIFRMLQSVTGPDKDGLQTISMNMWVYGEALKAIGKTQAEMTKDANERFKK